VTHAEAADLVRQLVATWNAGRPEAFAALFSDEAVYVTAAGDVRRGRAAIEELLVSPPPGPVSSEGKVTVRRHGDAVTMLFSWSGPARDGRTRQGVISCVVVPRAGGWLIDWLQNTETTRG
jgi:uncharacterized protein (TIGR02246 family)